MAANKTVITVEACAMGLTMETLPILMAAKKESTANVPRIPSSIIHPRISRVKTNGSPLKAAYSTIRITITNSL